MFVTVVYVTCMLSCNETIASGAPMCQGCGLNCFNRPNRFVLDHNNNIIMNDIRCLSIQPVLNSEPRVSL